MKKWWSSERSYDQIKADFEGIAQIKWTSPYPHREPDQAIEFLSQPIDGERSPQVRKITKELTMDVEYELE